MDNNHDKNIEQLIVDELEKLKETIVFLKNEKEVIDNLSYLLQRIENKYDKLENVLSVLNDEIAVKEKSLKANIIDNNVNLEKRLDNLWLSINSEFNKRSYKLSEEIKSTTLEQVVKITKNNKELDKKIDVLWRSLNEEHKNVNKVQMNYIESSVLYLKSEIKSLRTFTYISLSIIVAIFIGMFFLV